MLTAGQSPLDQVIFRELNITAKQWEQVQEAARRRKEQKEGIKLTSDQNAAKFGPASVPVR